MSTASQEHDPACITVSFNPDMELLRRQFAALPASSPKVLVDNASSPELVSQIEELVTATPNAHLLRNEKNLGLAAAINAGVEFVHARYPDATFALLLDQDSEPQPGSIEALLAAFRRLEKEGREVGCVGPLLRDPDTGLTHGFHLCTRWRWKRVYPSPGSSTPISCANLNGSGTLVPVSMFLQMGGLDEPLFIDHVDTEWGFRVIASGHTLWGIPNAVFDHRMGQASLRFWCFGWRIWPARSPIRHYFLFRNAVILMRRSYVPIVWKVWAVLKLSLTMLVHLAFDTSRWEQVRQMVKGIRQGIAG